MPDVAKRSPLKKYTRLMLAGALLGVFLAGWAAPTILEYWVAPVVPGQVFTCSNEVRWAALKTMEFQAIGAGVVALIFAIIGILVGRRRPESRVEPRA